MITTFGAGTGHFKNMSTTITLKCRGTIVTIPVIFINNCKRKQIKNHDTI